MRALLFLGLFSFVCTDLATVANAQNINIPIVFPLLSPRLSSNYGIRVHPKLKIVRHHDGIDLAAPQGSHVRTVTDGVVIFAGTYAGYGKLVTVRHDQHTVSLYGHLSSIQVAVGDKVSAGQLIGRVGRTGVATGAHLHFEWRVDGKSIDPLKAFPQLASQADG